MYEIGQNNFLSTFKLISLRLKGQVFILLNMYATNKTKISSHNLQLMV